MPLNTPKFTPLITKPGLGVLPALPSLTSFVSDVTLKSQISPDYTWTPSNQTSRSGGLTDLIMGFVKPSAYIRMPTGGVLRVEPWGAPRVNLFPVIVVGTLVLGALAVVSLIGLGKKLGSR